MRIKLDGRDILGRPTMAYILVNPHTDEAMMSDTKGSFHMFATSHEADMERVRMMHLGLNVKVVPIVVQAGL